MITCDNLTCTGHLGKYDSCRDEGLDAIAMDEGGTGDTSFEGYVSAPIVVSEPEAIDEDWISVTIPVGVYIVTHHNSGAVSVESFDDEASARAAYACAEARWAAWDDEDADGEPFVCPTHGYETV